MEIKTLSSAFVLSLLIAGPAVMAMGEDEQDKGGTLVVQPAVTPPIPEEIQDQTPAPTSTQIVDEVTTTPKVDSSKSWRILPWNWFGGSSTTTAPTVMAEQEKKDGSTTPVTVQEPAPQDEPTPAQDGTTDGPTPPTETKDDDSGMMNLIPVVTPSQTATTVPVEAILTWWERIFGKENKPSVVEVPATENVQVATNETDSPQVAAEPDSSSAAAVSQMPSDLSQSLLELPERLRAQLGNPDVQEKARELQVLLRDIAEKNKAQ